MVFHTRSIRRSGLREAKIFAMVAVLLPVLLGMAGLVIDGGLVMSSYRQTQNAADAAAMAGAKALLNNQSPSAAVTAYLSGNGMNLANAATVNNPPLNGPYANPSAPLSKNNYVEVILTNNVNVFLITLIPGLGNVQTVTARAVAGIEPVAPEAGVILLDPQPSGGVGLSEHGNPVLKVSGGIIIDSEGKGVDSSGNAVQVGNYTQGPAVSLVGNAKVESPYIGVVGGVASGSQNKFLDYNGNNPNTTLHAGSLPTPDPLLNVPTPTTANGVINRDLGSPSINNGNANGLVSPNVKTGGTVFLNPGIYASISINGGTVVFNPGIYVLKGGGASIGGNGSVTGTGVMFYNTGSDYNATTGAPDTSDGSASPNPPGGTTFGQLSIGGGGTFSLTAPTTGTFTGMAVYQRRWNTQSMSIGGNGSVSVSGTVYAKWAALSVGGTGAYSSASQLIVGSMSLGGNGDVTINLAGQTLAKTNQVFLVE